MITKQLLDILTVLSLIGPELIAKPSTGSRAFGRSRKQKTIFKQLRMSWDFLKRFLNWKQYDSSSNSQRSMLCRSMSLNGKKSRRSYFELQWWSLGRGRRGEKPTFLLQIRLFRI